MKKDFGENKFLAKEQIIQKQKKSWLISLILVGICCVGFLVCAIIAFCFGDDNTIIYAVILCIASLIAPIYFVYIYIKRTDADWIIDYTESKHIVFSPDVFRLLQDSNVIADNDFVLSKAIDITTTEWKKSMMFVDNQNKKFIYKKGKSYSKSYSFFDIINYEVYENGISKVQGRAGSALIGGAFFGLGGAIVGSSRSRNISEKCTQLKLLIRLNDLDCSQIVIVYVNNAGIDKSSRIYQNTINNLQSVCSVLEFMLNNKTLEQSEIKQSENKVEATKKEQLQELKEMLDEGLITQEDFDIKKKQILGL